MGLFDNLFGGKKSEPDTGTNDGQVDAPQSAEVADTAAPAVNNNVTISEDGQFAPPQTVQPQEPVQPEAEAAAAPEAEEPAAETTAPAEPTQEVVGPNESNLEAPTEPTESSEEKTV